MEMGNCRYAGLDQVQAVRESLRDGLNGVLSYKRWDAAEIRRWIHAQGVPLLPEDEEKLTVYWALTFPFEREFGTHLEVLIQRGAAPPGLFEIGAARSGASWKTPWDAIITSAFVRLLGCSEQFEIDVLKALFYYRPHGLLGDERDHVLVTAEVDVVHEEPGSGGTYSKPPVWTWLRARAEDRIERQKIFSRVFGVSVIPEGYPTKLKEWYDKRNAIAHGRSGVVMTLADYIDVEVFVARSMTSISDQCRKKLALVV